MEIIVTSAESRLLAIACSPHRVGDLSDASAPLMDLTIAEI